MLAARFTPIPIPEQEPLATPAITVLPDPGGHHPPPQTPTPPQPVAAVHDRQTTDRPRGLSAIKKKAPAKSESVKPSIPDPTGEIGVLAERIRAQREKIEQLEGAVDADSSAVIERAFPHYLAHNAQRAEPEDSFLIRTTGLPCLVLFPARYPKIKDAAATLPGIRALLGPSADQFFKTRNIISIDCERIPLALQDNLCADLVELFERHGCADALSQEEITKPLPEFHAARHRLFSTDINRALQAAFPITASVKTKGVKG
jgi:hypothetical protein